MRTLRGSRRRAPDAAPPEAGQRHEDAFVIRTLTKVYGEGTAAVRALRGIDLTLPDGELTVLLGPSGSGKSTLLNILGGIDTATDGEVLFRGVALTGASQRELTRYRRAHVGFVFQFYNLMPSLTALENVELVAEIAPHPVDPMEALALVGLEGRADHFPSELSGGEQQRVAIARAVAKNPTVLFCDEPTGALDSRTGTEVLAVLQDLNERLGTTTLIITHAAATAAMADRVVTFADGRVGSVACNEDKARARELSW
ncbi:ABC transporter ATP-binding protein [Parvularcula oceani]|uniref:ABC transporter ATP-binding protein n=1 Tax=Parvularcula oceani TaxID=1247963 RepID=UPI0009DF0DE2|nr:ABC transporter ATP-binding protein [Parvularcula oceani]